MDERIGLLLRELGLNWDEAGLLAEIKPFVPEQFLAEGGTAWVFEVKSNDAPGMSLVMKLPRVRDDDEPLDTPFDECLEALRHEARILSYPERLPNVVQVIADRTDEVFPFLVLQKLGRTLYDHVPDDSAGLALADCLKVLRDVATGLEALHSLQRPHLDVTPKNIFDGPDGWTLTDPCPREFSTEEFTHPRAPGDLSRDVIALGGLFLFVYRGEIGDLELVEGELEDETQELRPFMERVLFQDGESPVPSAKDVKEFAEELLRKRP
ncbi:MAG: hypothetical protein O7H41_20775 [Planctomycetota bacterium]|nr:hypothetical protein [Planctomycetota bacterium]